MKNLKILLYILLFLGIQTTKAQYTLLHSFNNTDGDAPHGALIFSTTRDSLYGMTASGGTYHGGVVFSIKINGSSFSDIFNFNDTNGLSPYGALTLSVTNDTLFGMTVEGGDIPPYNNDGNIFSIRTNGSGYNDLIDFNYTNGRNPYGDLTLLDGVLYGMTCQGESYGRGNIFSINTNGSGYNSFYNFNSPQGWQPTGSLTVSITEDTLYGMTEAGGANYAGNIFSIHKDGTGFVDMHDFNETDGDYPRGTLTRSITGDTLYGMTPSGGAYLYGNIFSIHNDGSGFTDIYDFNTPGGYYPYGSLLLAGDVLYGMTEYGGVSGDGTIFSIHPDGTHFTDLLDFNGTNGANPDRTTLIISGGLLYGMTTAGGTYGYGTIFSYNICSLTASITGYENVTCNGGTTNVNVTASGGTTPYTYLWSDANSQTTATATGLSAGTYTVTVNGGCSATATVTITQPATPLSISIASQTNVLCNGSPTGSITANTATGGTTTYSYNWTPSGGTNLTASGLSAGSYTITVTDYNGCMATASATITQPSSAVGISIASQTDILCNGSSTGSATANAATGGIPPYTYSWAPSGGTNLTASNLSAGTYTISASDNNGCTATASVNITQPTALSVSTSISTNISCNGGENGSVTATPSGGTSPYTYLWNDPNSQTTATASGLSSTTYTVTVDDNNGCTATASIDLTQPASAFSYTATVQSEVKCNDGDHGWANIPGIYYGTTPYTYLWSTGSTTASTSNLTAGSYTVTVTDNTGACKTEYITITQPSAPVTTTISITQPLCYGETGTITATPSGGVSPYSYVWNGSGSSSSATVNYTAYGGYNLKVEDANGCTSTLHSFSITQPALLTASITSQSCSGSCSGTAHAGVSGGVTPYTYSWSSGQTTASVSSECAGTYTCNVTDNNGCMASTSVTFTCTMGVLRDSYEGGGNLQEDSLGIITLYPDPNNGAFSITGLYAGENLELYNTLGQLIEQYKVSGATMQFDIKSEPSGLYIIHVISKEGIAIKHIKLIKQ